MEQIISGLILAVVTGGFAVSYKQFRKLFRKVELVNLKHDGLVHALQLESKNGLMKNYKEYLKDKIQDDEFINK